MHFYSGCFFNTSRSDLRHRNDNMRTPNREEVIIQGIFSLVAIFGIIGNSLVVTAVCKKRSLRSTTNYLLVNLAISDIIVLVGVHLCLIERYVQFENGAFADFLCKFLISFNVPATGSIASIFTLTILAVERYHAIVKPMRTGMRLREETVKYTIIGVWFTAMVITLPMYILSSYDKKFSLCRFNIKKMQTPDKVYRVVGMIIIILIPLITIVFCYFEIIRELYFKNSVSPQNVAVSEEVKNKRKLIKVAIYVTASFLMCYLPPSIITFITASSHTGINTNSQMAGFAWVLYFLEAVFNPLIYSFQSSNFREAFKEILRLPQTTR